MNATNNSDNGWWCKPQMNVENQSAFWDAQSDVYEGADMTNDNQQEMDVVIGKCRELSYEDMVTLGGAVGCRDPKLILSDLLARKCAARPTLFFNDLSPKQVQRARDIVLKPFTKIGCKVSYHPGEIREVCKEIEPRPRRLLIGIYDCRSFFDANPDAGYPLCGYDEYIKNRAILGNEFLLEWVKLAEDKKLVSCGIRAKVSCDDESETIAGVKKVLSILRREIIDGAIGNINVLQIIGQKADRKGFFISHWYTPNGMLQMISEIFPTNDFSISVSRFAKGTVFTIDPVVQTPVGVVTVLNNVIGNVLPHDQYKTLQSIRGIVV